MLPRFVILVGFLGVAVPGLGQAAEYEFPETSKLLKNRKSEELVVQLADCSAFLHVLASKLKQVNPRAVAILNKSGDKALIAGLFVTHALMGSQKTNKQDQEEGVKRALAHMEARIRKSREHWTPIIRNSENNEQYLDQIEDQMKFCGSLVPAQKELSAGFHAWNEKQKSP